MSDTERGDVAMPDTTKIVRDPTFVRFVADQAAYTYIGRDVDVSFLQMGPDHRFRYDHGEYETYDSVPILSEVARMRINFPDMLGVAMNFLRLGIIEDRLKGPAIRDALDGWIAEAATAKAEDGDE